MGIIGHLKYDCLSIHFSGAFATYPSWILVGFLSLSKLVRRYGIG